MLNPKVRKIYPENTVKELEVLAAEVEAKNIKVRIGLPASRVVNQVFPRFLGLRE